jgi:hypothetical protein
LHTNDAALRLVVFLMWGPKFDLELFESMKMQCDCCKGNFFRRLNRKGLVERTFLPLVGVFPWECPLCRYKVFLRDSGMKADRKLKPVASLPVAAYGDSLAFASREHRQ